MVGVAARGTTPANSYLLVATDQGLYRSTNGGTTFAQISGTGILPLGGIFDLAADPGAPVSVVSGATWSANTATITTVNAHALIVGQRVIVTGVNAIGGSSSGYNGTFTVTGVTANTFTYAISPNPGVYVSGGTVTSDPTLDPLARNRFYIALKSAAGTVTGVGGAGVYRSDDGGLTWGTAPVTSPIMQIGANTTNVQISVFNSGIITNNIVYVAVENNNPTGSAANLTGFNRDYAWVNRLSQVSTISWSPNQGGTWTRMDAPRTQTNQQTADVTSSATGVVTVSTGVRHHLRTGDQVVISGVLDNGVAPTGTPPAGGVPPALIAAINGVRYVTFVTETTFTLNNVVYTGTYLHFNQDLMQPVIFPNGLWTQILGAAAGERPEFFDLVADRVNSNIIYLGTDRTAASAGDGEGSQFFSDPTLGPTAFTTTIWKGDRLVNPTGFGNTAVNSAQWTSLVNKGTANGSAPPADVRDLAIGANGQLLAGTGQGLYVYPTPAVSSSSVIAATWAAGLANITTALPHNFTVGQSVTITNLASATPAPGSATGYNGTFTITSVTSNSFAYALAANPGQFIDTDSVAANVATVQMLSPHGFTVGQSVKIFGVVPGGYNGTFTITSTPGATQDSAPDTIQAATWSAGVATITTNALHGVQVGQTVAISGVSVAGYNGGPFIVTSVNVALKQFTYALATYPGNVANSGNQRNAADAITSGTWASAVATITTTAAHNIVSGQTVTIAGVNITGFNGTFVVTTLDAFRFTYTLAVNPGGTGTGGTATTAINNITSATWSATVATITTQSVTGAVVGDTVTINGVSVSGYNGTFVVTAVNSPTQFTYTLSNDPANATGGLETPISGQNSITTATWAGGVATITTVAANNVSVGESVVIAGILSTGPGSFNGTFTVTGVSGTSFTYSLALDPGTATRTRPTSFTHTLNAVLPFATTSSNATVVGAGVPGGTTWQTLNGNLSITSVFSVAYDTQSDRAFAGTVDNQAISQVATGGNAYAPIFTNVDLRDNFFEQANVFRVVVDNTRIDNNGFADGLTKRYYVGTNFSNIIRQTVNASDVVTGSQTLFFASPLTTGSRNSGLVGADAAQLNNANETVHIAMALNQNDPRRAMFGYGGLYEDADPSGSTPTGAIVNNVTPPGMTGKVESILYGGKRAGVNFNQVVYMTTTTGELWVRGEFGPVFTNITAALTAASGQPGASVFSVVGDPDDYRHIFVAQGGKILESQDFGGTFVDISDNLIGPPTADGTAGPGKLTTEIRSLAINDTNPGVAAVGDLTLVAGGRGGVYRLQTTIVNTGGSWTEYGTALPNTVVNDLQLYSNQRLIAGTAGRGIWTIADVSTTINRDSILTIGGTAASDIITVSVDPDNSNIILVFDGTVTTSWTRGAFSALQINGFGGADQIIIASTIDRITHVPIAGANVDFVNFKITVDGGGDAGDTLRIIDEGVTTARQVTITSTTIGDGAADTIFNGSGKVDYSGFDAGTVDISTGSGDDTYILTSLMPGQTILRGGSGSETYNTAMDPASTSVLTIVEGVTTGIDALNITGTIGNDTFSVGAAQVALGTSKVNYSGIEDFAVSGAIGNDTFNFTGAGGSVSNTFDGQAGNDVYKIPLNPTTLTTYTVSDTGLVGTDDLEVTGTAGSDTFSITSARVLLGLGAVDYSGIENLTVDALAGDDTYNLTLNPASTTNFTIADTGGTDTLRVTGTAGVDAFSISSTQVVLGTKAADYSGIENLAVLGVNGNDTFNMTGAGGSVGTTLDGGGGNDTYNVSMNPATATLLTVNDTGVGGTDALNITGTAVADAFTVAPTQVLLGSETLNFTSNIENLRLSGLAGADTFTMSTEGGSANTTIDGGSGIDAFSIFGTSGTDSVGVDITSALGDGSFTGLPQNVAFTSIQNLGFDGGAGTNSFTWRDRTDIAYGTALNPENGIVYTPSGAAKGSLRVGNGSAYPTVDFSNINSTFLVNADPDGSGDRDVFTVLGFSTAGSQSGFPFNEPPSADGSDTFVVSDGAITLTNAALGSMRRVDFALAASGSGARTVSTIFVVGGNEAATGDRFTVTPSRLTNIVINGMNPVAGSAADQLTVISNGATTSFRTTDSKYGAPQSRMQQTIDGAAVGFYNIENVSVFDPSRGGPPPLINIFGAASVNEGAPYALTLGALTDPGRTVTSYIVHWGDGITDTFTTNGAKSHTYADGTNAYSITVDLVDEYGLHLNVANSSVRSLAVNNVAPTIAVSAGGTVAEGIASTLTLGAVTDPGRDTVSTFIVRWGDGNSNAYSTGGIKTHIYAGVGTYAVAVDLVDEDGVHANRGGTTLNVVTQELLDASKTNLTAAGVGADVVVYNSNGTTRFAFKPYEGYTGNVTVATGDITGDGIDDIVTGAESQVTHVKVFNGATGIEIASFLAYEGFLGGVTVAAGDVLGLGRAQVITGAGPGGGPHVKVFDVSGGGSVESRSFFAYDAGFLGGVSVGAGRLNSSGHDMIVTGAGVGGSSHVKAFDVAGRSPAELRSFFAFDPGFSGGVNVAAAFGNIAVGAGAGRGGHVQIFRFADGATLQSFFAYPDYDGGVRVAFGTRSGIPTIVTGVGLKTPPRFQVFRLADLAALDRFFIGNVAFDGGIYVG